MNIEVFVVNSFANSPNGGNPAGVVLDSDFTEEQMLSIAKEIGFPETAFLNKIDKTHYKIRFFTPVAEVDLCGHATIAAFSLLKEKNLITNGEYFLNTKVGEICVIINKNVFMTQNLPEFSEIIDKNEILPCFDIIEGDFYSDIPIQVVSTGLRDILLPVKSLYTLLKMKPDFQKIAKLSKKYNTIGIHAFTLETMFKSTAHCRNFAPLYGIPEESATGTSSGALSCFLYNYNVINADDAKNLVFEQGYSMNAPSKILTSLNFDKDKINSVAVGGNAIIAKSIKLVI